MRGMGREDPEVGPVYTGHKDVCQVDYIIVDYQET